MAFVKLFAITTSLTICRLVHGSYVDEPLLYDSFPAGFMWAAATAAYQVEGGWNSDGNLAT